MAQFLETVWLIVATLISIILTAVLANKLAAREIPTFFKGAIGALCGVFMEGIRLLLAVGVISLFVADPSFNGLSAWLAVFRMFNIPILVGFGFMIGSAAVKTKTINCPGCKKSVGFSLPDLKNKAGFSKELKEACPLCKTTLVFETETFEIIAHEKANEPDSAIEPSTTDEVERIPCLKCGAAILPATAERTGGVCMPCKKKSRA